MPLTVHVTSLVSAEETRKTIQTMTQWGWYVRTLPQRAEPADVAICLVTPEQSQATEYEPGWPLRVSSADIQSELVRDRLVRRDEIQLRRQAYRSLTTLFKKAIADRGPRGGGFRFAPQWWFITNLERVPPDTGGTDEPTPPRPTGSPYLRAFTPRVRQHFHAMFRAVQVDMIFIEDGVNHRMLIKVLRVLFEHFDKHGTKRAVDDHSFRGLTKVKVMIHDYTPGKPFQSTTYEEPEFDEMSRARILHIFRDHGGDEAEVEDPFDFSWEPSPSLGMS
jgi:hypothetical protein